MHMRMDDPPHPRTLPAPRLPTDIAGGKDNVRRLTGAHETAAITAFSWGVANRGCSIRIPRFTERDDCGYFEDRRPASNMDPYKVTAKIMETCVLPDVDIVQNLA